MPVWLFMSRRKGPFVVELFHYCITVSLNCIIMFLDYYIVGLLSSQLSQCYIPKLLLYFIRILSYDYIIMLYNVLMVLGQ